ncbi:MAG TPA: lysozyme inhibitor LprI family protein, partial [Beijerinckiaceae bacterium]|nr:lysozyme inhibitor LprI family protein [Beijerinckiaceae bacterium]
MIRTLVAVALLSFATGPAVARSASRDGRRGFESLYRSMRSFRKADRTLNLDFSRLNSKLGPARRLALKADELAWLQRRDQECG